MHTFWLELPEGSPVQVAGILKNGFGCEGGWFAIPRYDAIWREGEDQPHPLQALGIDAERVGALQFDDAEEPVIAALVGWHGSGWNANYDICFIPPCAEFFFMVDHERIIYGVCSSKGVMDGFRKRLELLGVPVHVEVAPADALPKPAG